MCNKMEHRREDGSLSQGYFCYRCGQVSNMYNIGHGVDKCEPDPELVDKLLEMNSRPEEEVLVEEIQVAPEPKSEFMLLAEEVFRKEGMISDVEKMLDRLDQKYHGLRVGAGDAFARECYEFIRDLWREILCV